MTVMRPFSTPMAAATKRPIRLASQMFTPELNRVATRIPITAYMEPTDRSNSWLMIKMVMARVMIPTPRPGA